MTFGGVTPGLPVRFLPKASDGLFDGRETTRKQRPGSPGTARNNDLGAADLMHFPATTIKESACPLHRTTSDGHSTTVAPAAI